MTDKIPDMDEMIKACEAKKTDDEIIAFALGGGRILPLPFRKKGFKKALEIIKKQQGFLGIHPVDLWHTLLIFDTLNNAKMARNVFKSQFPVGQVVPILIPKNFKEVK